jgi:hypothetical protein
MDKRYKKTKARSNASFGNEKSCEAERGIVLVPVVVEPVPVQLDLTVVLNEIRGVEVIIVVPNECAECLPFHQPLSALWFELHSASEMP